MIWQLLSELKLGKADRFSVATGLGQKLENVREGWGEGARLYCHAPEYVIIVSNQPTSGQRTKRAHMPLFILRKRIHIYSWCGWRKHIVIKMYKIS